LNIKNNIVNYLYDRDYVICTYENNVYIFNYNYLESFNDKKIVLKVSNKKVSINGINLIIKKITKEEMLIQGSIKSIEMSKYE